LDAAARMGSEFCIMPAPAPWHRVNGAIEEIGPAKSTMNEIGQSRCDKLRLGLE